MSIDAFHAGNVPFTWYIDEILVQQAKAAATNHLKSTCKAMIAAGTAIKLRTMFVVTRKFALTTMLLVMQQYNFLSSPSFEQLTIVSCTDANGYPTRATG